MEPMPRNEYQAPTEVAETDIFTGTALPIENAMGADAQSGRGHLTAAAFEASSKVAVDDTAGDAVRGRAAVEQFLGNRPA